jgi:uncharacterized protein YjbJ (UPF0337 family)
MTESSKDRIGGMMDQAKGTAKEAWGRATGDEDTEAEGQIDQAKGRAKEGLADARDAVDDVVDELTD